MKYQDGYKVPTYDDALQPITRYREAARALYMSDPEDLLDRLQAAAVDLVVAAMSDLLENGKFLTEKGYYCFDCNYMTHPSQYKGIPHICAQCGVGQIYTPMMAVREDVKRRIAYYTGLGSCCDLHNKNCYDIEEVCCGDCPGWPGSISNPPRSGSEEHRRRTFTINVVNRRKNKPSGIDHSDEVELDGSEEQSK